MAYTWRYGKDASAALAGRKKIIQQARREARESGEVVEVQPAHMLHPLKIYFRHDERDAA